MSVKMSITWFVNVLGIILSGAGAFFLALSSISFKSKYEIGSWGYSADKSAYERTHEVRTKIAVIFIPIGAGLQLLAQFLDC
jgi:hypothetical protein